MLLNVPPDGVNACNAFQSFKIATASGQLTFNGATTHSTGAPVVRNLPTFLANNKTAYGINNFVFLTSFGDQDIYLNDGTTFARESNGTLEFLDFSWPFPAPYGGMDLYQWIPIQVTADPTNHLAVAMYPWYDPPKGTSRGPQLASYTADSEGKITTTNTCENMPLSDLFPTVLNMSPDGKLLAVAGGGLEVFHFNGAAPITRYSQVLTTESISWIHWDKTNVCAEYRWKVVRLHRYADEHRCRSRFPLHNQRPCCRTVCGAQ